ncbi:MAG: hypothetical protein SZ59_C0005G0043 [candidate division TM6 bacterium GW2011_GWF2_28_16]|nr:MAG: hypothetical protein SZ59_C0005G0043 [candidate division TM6 bacterium GW2011_GWF2_28_16]
MLGFWDNIKIIIVSCLIFVNNIQAYSGVSNNTENNFILSCEYDNEIFCLELKPNEEISFKNTCKIRFFYLDIKNRLREIRFLQDDFILYNSEFFKIIYQTNDQNISRFGLSDINIKSIYYAIKTKKSFFIFLKNDSDEQMLIDLNGKHLLLPGDVYCFIGNMLLKSLDSLNVYKYLSKPGIYRFFCTIKNITDSTESYEYKIEYNGQEVFTEKFFHTHFN